MLNLWISIAVIVMFLAC